MKQQRLQNHTRVLPTAKYRSANTLSLAAAALGLSLLLSGCHVDMWMQPKAKPNNQSDFFANEQASRPLVAGTVPQGALRLADAYHSGYDPDGKLTKKIPAMAVTAFESPKAMLLRGQDRFNVYCQPCHGKSGDGDGMIMQRGLGYWQKLAASYHTDKLRKVEDGHIYDVLTNGYGVMYGYGSRIQDVNDRWAIVAYVRALQRAQVGVPATPDLQDKIKASATDASKYEGTADEPGDVPAAGTSIQNQGAPGVNHGQ
jgi:mono/diheme cytochrome c family protein